MWFLPKKRSIIICSVLIFLIITPFAMLKVEALLGGGVGLNLNPSSGVTGTVIQVSLDIPSWLKNRGRYESPSLYYNTEFSLFWDIGGWGIIKVPAETQNLAKTKTPIGTAQVDSKGLLTGKVTIPPSEVGDEHVIFAIPKNPDSMETLSHFWGFFHVTGIGTAPTTPTPTPTPSPTPHPDNCTLTVNWSPMEFTVKINGENILSNSSYWATYPYGTTVSLYGAYIGDDGQVEWEGWDIIDSAGRHGGPGPHTINIVMDEDKTAEPKTKNTGQIDIGNIPGFPFESIFIGLLLAIGLLYMTKRKLKIESSIPK